MPMHGLDERADTLRRGVLRYSVPQVEDVPGTCPEVVQDRAGLAFYHVRRGEKDSRIEVALERHAVAHALARAPEALRPIDAQRVRAALGHRFQPASAPLGEEDPGHDPALVLARE